MFLKFFIFFPEAFNSTRCVDKFLFTGKKRMAFGAYFNTDIRPGRTDLYLIAACASYARFSVFRMNSVLHVICNPLCSNDERRIICRRQIELDNLCCFKFDGFVHQVVLPIKHSNKYVKLYSVMHSLILEMIHCSWSRSFFQAKIPCCQPNLASSAACAVSRPD